MMRRHITEHLLKQKTSDINKINGTVCSFNDFDENLIFFIANPFDYIQKHHLKGYLYEEEELKIIQENSLNAKRFIDIGAHIGNHSIFFAKVLKAEEVIVFEANPQTCELLKINIRLNNLSSVINSSYLGLGLGSKVEELNLLVPKNNSAGARNIKESQVRNKSLLQIKTPSLPIDEIDITGIFDFIKIDVEGMEIDVLIGMEELLKRSRPKMFIEVDDKNMGSFHEWCKSHKYKITQEFKRYETNTNFLLIPEI